MRRFAPLLLLGSFGLSLLAVAPQPYAGTAAPSRSAAQPSIDDRFLNPNGQVLAVNAHLRRILKDAAGRGSEYLAHVQKEIRHLRFFSFYELKLTPEDVPLFRRVFNCWLNHLSFNANPAFCYVVPESAGWVVALDIRDANWNAAAFHAVASRERHFREPAVINHEATFLRLTLGLDQDPRTLHVEGVLNAMWFFRETIEADRSPSYYDLLYASQRFPPAPPTFSDRVTKEIVTEDVVEILRHSVTFYHPGGPYTPKDGVRPTRVMEAGTWVDEWEERIPKTITRVVERTLKVRETASQKPVNFPANLADWEIAFGIKQSRDFFKKQKIDPRHGAVVAGGRDSATRGSVVARNNRLLEFIQIVTCTGAVALATYDVAASVGKHDFTEQYPKLIVIGEIRVKVPAKELLATLPNGCQASLLVNADDDRVDVADNRFAIDRNDPLDVRVRTPGSCVICHAPRGGFIEPVDVVRGLWAGGNTLKIKDRNQKLLLESFFLGWSDEANIYQQPYVHAIRKTTADVLHGLPGMLPGQFASVFRRMRSWYDAPLSIEQQAAEVGVPVAVLRWLGSRSPRAQLNQTALGREHSRITWDEDIYPELVNLLDAYSGDEALLKIVPEYVTLRFQKGR